MYCAESSSLAPSTSTTRFSPAIALQLSLHCLPCLASLLLLDTSCVNTRCSLDASDSLRLEGSNSSSSGRAGSSSSSSGSSVSSSGRASSSSNSPGSSGSSSGRDGSSSSGRDGSNSSTTTTSSGSNCNVGPGGSPTACQLQLFELLSFTPQLASVMQQMQPEVSPYAMLRLIDVCLGCNDAAMGMVATSQGPQAEGNLQRWQFEQQLWLLLPSVLLPCANPYFWLATDSGSGRSSGSANHSPQDPEQQDLRDCMMQLENLTGRALAASADLKHWWGGGPINCIPPHPALMGEALNGVLQLADQVQQLQQQQQQQQQQQLLGDHNAAPGNTQRGMSAPAAATNGASSSTGDAVANEKWVACAGHLSHLVALLVPQRNWFVCRDSTALLLNEPSSTNAAAAAASNATTVGTAPLVTAVAENFGEVCRALEAGLRVVWASAQSGSRCYKAAELIDMVIDHTILSGKRWLASMHSPATWAFVGLKRWHWSCGSFTACSAPCKSWATVRQGESCAGTRTSAAGRLHQQRSSCCRVICLYQGQPEQQEQYRH